jgi:hypothetical protein
MRNQQIDEESTIRIVSNKQMRFEVESFMHKESNDDVMRSKSVDRSDDQIIWFLFFLEKTNQFYHVMIVSFYHLNFYHCIASFIYLSTYFLNLASRCSDWSFLLIDQMSDVDQMKLFQKFFVLLSRQHFDKIICWHLCCRTSVNTDSIRLNLLSQSMSMNINML